MKYITSVICAIAFAVAGMFLADMQLTSSQTSGYKTLRAATVETPVVFPSLPNAQMSVIRDTVRDTIFCGQEIMVIKDKSKVHNKMPKGMRTPQRAAVKRKGYNTPVVKPDSTVQNQVCEVREEHTSDTIGPPKTSIILVVDGKEVYKR